MNIQHIPGRFEQNWTADEIMTLRTAWRDPNIAREAIPGMLRDRTLRAVRRMAHTLGLGPRPKPEKAPETAPHVEWTAADDETLKQLWHTVTRQEVASFLGRSPDAVSNRAYRLQLGPSQYQRAKLAEQATALLHVARAQRVTGSVWTEAELATLRDLWPDVSAIHVATRRSWAAIERQAGKLKLPRRTKYAKQERGPSEKRLVPPAPRPPMINRRCLCCGVAFKAETRFIRMCGPCKGHRV